MKKIALIVVVLLVATTVFVACGGQKVEDKPLAVVTIPPLQTYLSQLVGSSADVVCIMPADVAPSDYRPTDEDLAVLENAEFVLINGGDIDDWTEGHIDAKTSFSLLDYATEHDLTEYNKENPFVYLDLYAMREIGLILAPILEEAMPSVWNAKSNAFELEVELTTLENNWKNRFRRADQRVFAGMTSAWNYITGALDLVYVNIADGGIPENIEIPGRWRYESPDGGDNYEISTVILEPGQSTNFKVDKSLNTVIISTLGDGEGTYSEYIDGLITELYQALR